MPVWRTILMIPPPPYITQILVVTTIGIYLFNVSSKSVNTIFITFQSNEASEGLKTAKRVGQNLSHTHTHKNR